MRKPLAPAKVIKAHSDRQPSYFPAGTVRIAWCCFSPIADKNQPIHVKLPSAEVEAYVQFFDNIHGGFPRFVSNGLCISASGDACGLEHGIFNGAYVLGEDRAPFLILHWRHTINEINAR